MAEIIETPFISFGNDEIDKIKKKNPSLPEGIEVEHQHPDGTWETAVVGYGIGDDGIKTEAMCTYKLKDGRVYLAGIDGHLLPRENLRIKEL